MKRILMVMPYCNDISVYPSVYQMAQVLKETGYEVTLVTSNSIKDYRVAKYFDKIISLPYFKKRNPVTLLLNSLMFSFHILRCKTDLIMVFDHNGAEASAVAVLLKRKVKYIYFNLEVYTNQNNQHENIKFHYIKFFLRKRIEIWFNKKCSIFIIQDPIRYRLSGKYGISHETVFFLPNSYIYDESLISLADGVSRHNKVLFAGALDRWSIEELIKNLECFKNIDFTLSGWLDSEYLEKVKAEINKYDNIRMNDNQMSADDYTEYLKKFDIGFVYYSWCEDENIYNMGLASGKFFKYLSLGKPIIVQRLPGMAEEVEKNGLGIVIDSLSEVEAAVEKIATNYISYQERIFKIYRDDYDYRKLAYKVIKKINKLDSI